MSHGPASERRLTVVKSNPSPVEESHPPSPFSPAFMRLREQEESSLVEHIRVLALACMPAYVQTDGYRRTSRQYTRLGGGTYTDLLNENEARRAQIYTEKKPLELLIAKHVIEAIPKGHEEIQCEQLIDYNNSPGLRRVIRCVDVDSDIHLESHDYYLLEGGGWACLYENGPGHEQFYEHGSPEVEAFGTLYAEIGKRAMSVEDTNVYLGYIASRRRLSHL